MAVHIDIDILHWSASWRRSQLLRVGVIEKVTTVVLC